MQANDLEKFLSGWTTMAELFGRDLSKPAVKLAFSLLADYEIGEVTKAMRAHSMRSKFMATPADIVELIEGRLPTDAVLIGLARKCDTPLGWKARSIIGSFDFRQLNEYQLSERVKSLRPLLQDFFERSKTGNFSDNEIACMVSADIDPTKELCIGLPSVRLPFQSEIQKRVGDCVETARLEHDNSAPEKTERDSEIGRKRLAELMQTLGQPQASSADL